MKEYILVFMGVCYSWFGGDIVLEVIMLFWFDFVKILVRVDNWVDKECYCLIWMIRMMLFCDVKILRVKVKSLN